MDIKLFSAQYVVKKTGSFQDIRKITSADFDTEAFIVGGFKSDDGTQKNIFEKICSVFEEAFFNKNLKNTDDFERLEEALKIVNEVIKDDFANFNEHVLREGGFLIAIFADSSLYFTSCGTPEVYFIRRGRFTVISEGLAEPTKNGEIFSNVASGELKDDDKIIFTTSRLLRHVTGNQIADAVQSGVTESIEALKFILVDDEPVALSVFHIKTLSTLPFEKGKEGGGFFNKMKEKEGMTSKKIKTPKVINKAWDKVSSLSWRHRNAAIAFAVLIGLVLVAIFFGLLSQQQNDAQKETYRQEIQQLETDLSNAEARHLEGKITEANNLLDRVEEKANEINEAGYFRQEVMAILEEAQNKRNEINGITRLSGARVVADLSSAKESVDLKGIFENDAENYAYDTNTLFQVLADGTVENIYALKENENVIDGVPFEAKSEMIFLTDSGKIIEFADGEGSFASTTDNAFKTGVEVTTFSKYMYLLSPTDNEIWKYERKDAGFDQAQEYNVDADLKNAISFAIDGNVFILTSDGQVIKLYRGKQEDYGIKDAPDGNLAGCTKIYTNEKLEKIYFLNPSEKSILIFSKGTNEAYYQRQVVIEDVDEIHDFWVDPATERMLVVDKNKIYEVKL